MLGIDQSEQEQGGATPASDRNIKNGRFQRARYLKVPNLSSFFFAGLFFNIATSTLAAKQHQVTVFIGRLTG